MFDFVLNVRCHRTFMDDFIHGLSICCDNSTKRNILTMLNDIDVRFFGTNPQLFAISLN